MKKAGLLAFPILAGYERQLGSKNRKSATTHKQAGVPLSDLSFTHTASWNVTKRDVCLVLCNKQRVMRAYTWQPLCKHEAVWFCLFHRLKYTETHAKRQLRKLLITRPWKKKRFVTTKSWKKRLTKRKRICTCVLRNAQVPNGKHRICISFSTFWLP